MEETKYCPKCGAPMEEHKDLHGIDLADSVVVRKKGWKAFFGDLVVPFVCSKCGYIELYKKQS